MLAHMRREAPSIVRQFVDKDVNVKNNNAPRFPLHV